jgi:hypothetical protein
MHKRFNDFDDGAASRPRHDGPSDAVLPSLEPLRFVVPRDAGEGRACAASARISYSDESRTHACPCGSFTIAVPGGSHAAHEIAAVDIARHAASCTFSSDRWKVNTRTSEDLAAKIAVARRRAAQHARAAT